MSRVDLSIYDSEAAVIERLVAASPDIETGGELLGLWSHGGGPTVMLATGPSPHARREVTSFMQPPRVHMDLEAHAWKMFGLQVLGIWHSHHRLGLHDLSGGDRQRTRSYARRHGRRSYAEILGFIHDDGAVGLRPYVYRDALVLQEVPVSLRHISGTSPVRLALAQADLPEAIRPCLLPFESPSPAAQPELAAAATGDPGDQPPVDTGSPVVSPEAGSTSEEAVITAVEDALGAVAGRGLEDVRLDLRGSIVVVDLRRGETAHRLVIDTGRPFDLELHTSDGRAPEVTMIRAADPDDLADFYVQILNRLCDTRARRLFQRTKGLVWR